VKRAFDFGLQEKAIYKHGDMAITGLSAETFEAVVSIDALWNASDKHAVLQEIKRLLRPNGRFVFTTWEQRAPDGVNLPPSLCYRAMLRDAGFKTVIYEETANWETLQREIYRRWIASKNKFIQEIGLKATELLMNEAIKMTVTLNDGTDQLSHIRRMFIVACS
jgi:ubiquinone/menaquinone biosynthesis C-methylase UbiE